MKKLTFVFLVSLIALTFLVGTVSAKTIRTPYSGEETCYDMSGGWDWVSNDSVWHFRDGVQPCTDVTTDDRMTGDVEVTVNFNWKFTDPPAMFYGPMWGTVYLENEGGYWEGSWVGVRTELGYHYVRTILRGYGGYEGLQARVDYVRLSPDPTAPYQVTGFIMNPGGK